MNRKILFVLAGIAGLSAAVFLTAFGPQILQAAAPIGGRITKFAVQRARGIAIGGGCLLVVAYLGIAISMAFQGRADHGSEALESK